MSVSVRSAVVLVAAACLCGCSFSGSVEGATGSSASSRSSASEAASSTTDEPSTGTGASASSTGAATDTSGASTALSRCHTGDLTASLQPGSPGAGQRYATLALTDSGDRPCTIHGFGGLGLAGPGGAPVPTKQVRVTDPTPGTITLRPGATATSQLHWGAVAGPGDTQSGNCQPVATTLRVIPPDETQALSVPWDQGPVCQGGTIEQKPYTG
jgi:hypothetical protein